MISQTLRPLKTLSRRTILKQDKFLTVESHTVEFPNKEIISDWSWVITPDYVIVVPVTGDGNFLCFRQINYGIEGTSLAPVGGYIEPNETPIIAAKRELLEETGYEASEWINLGRYRVDPNRGIAMGNIYLARNANYVTKPNSDDREDQQLHILNKSEIQKALESGEFKVLSWTAGIALALNYLRTHSKPS